MAITEPSPRPRPVLTRPGARTAASAEHQAALAARLTPRDRWLTRMIAEYKVLTTDQIVQIAFPSRRAANHRLRSLYTWRVLDRFQPLLPRGQGSAPAHYVLDIAGATLLAHEDGLDPKKIGYRHDRAIGIAHSQHRNHTVAVNAFFTSLIATARRPGSKARLLTWWSETRCLHEFGDLARPDGYGRWRQDGRDVAFFLELDRGTEPLPRLARKLTGYEDLASNSGTVTPLLFWLPSPRREAGARQALAAALRGLSYPDLAPIATTAADIAALGHGCPTAKYWLPLAPSTTSTSRLSLFDLAVLWPHDVKGQPQYAAAAQRRHGLRAPDLEEP
ncbi:replication-relaxation family protein [Frankia sp. CNm7]|uniref:Replication-relaxation family protein n=1 Tax=Frankia nepalensis TaxID=1836974 RepID=A0A937RH37_9ACTN|nr:replication-relaxation family protein [Frankia nepalensis]MBL7496190.1 replication-relaxation family protein [Frankia nepalensis]MBL7511600.1 replication-relaxation family protein [Frankia nepalensis]MBL7520630.1 replication-relaxation family protein [Frankia nepalensis]MBL7630275.1 replication-relaxation family protein [Frankia nepalensis]